MKSLHTPRPSAFLLRRRLNYIGVLAISLLCLLLIFASHRYASTDDYTSASRPLVGGTNSLLSSNNDDDNEYNEYNSLINANSVPQRAGFAVGSSGAAAAAAAAVAGDTAYETVQQLHRLNVFRAHRNRDYQHHLQQRRYHSRSNSINGNNGGNGVTSVASTELAAGLTIAEIIAAQRRHIDADMLNFEFAGGATAQSLSALRLADGGQPMRSLIITTWRSGSTFLGDILNALPGNFYHYEPLLNYDIRQLRPADADAGAAVQQLQQLLACNYSGSAMAEYLEFGRDHNYQHNHNTRLWRYCRTRPQLCSDPEFLGAFCEQFPLQSMKVVRIRLQLADKLLAAPELGDRARVVLLVRDPRGVLQSRKHRDWCPGRPDCDRAERLCADMVEDAKAVQRLQRRWPSRVKWMRYEDLSVEPYGRTQELLAFLGLPFDAAVEEFLDSHTRMDAGGVSSTFRDSKAAPFHWMTDLSWREVQEIQGWCGEAMRRWGYVEAERRSVLKRRGWSPLGNVTVGGDDDVDGEELET